MAIRVRVRVRWRAYCLAYDILPASRPPMSRQVEASPAAPDHSDPRSGQTLSGRLTPAPPPPLQPPRPPAPNYPAVTMALPGRGRFLLHLAAAAGGAAAMGLAAGSASATTQAEVRHARAALACPPHIHRQSMATHVNFPHCQAAPPRSLCWSSRGGRLCLGVVELLIAARRCECVILGEYSSTEPEWFGLRAFPLYNPGLNAALENCSWTLAFSWDST